MGRLLTKGFDISITLSISASLIILCKIMISGFVNTTSTGHRLIVQRGWLVL